MAQLHTAVRDVSDPMVVMRRVVDQALVLLPRAEGAVVELAIGDELVYACASGALAEHVGTRLRSGESFSGESIRLGRALYCRDAAEDGRVDRDACRRVGARSLLCVPLSRSGLTVGVLKVTACRSDAFAEADIATLARLASFVSVAITAWSDLSRTAEEILAGPESMGKEFDPASGGESGVDVAVDHEGLGQFVANVLRPGIVVDVAAVERIHRVIMLRALDTVGQPIVDLQTGCVVGVEALTRFLAPPCRSPDVWFEEARSAGLGVKLELTAVEAAMALADKVPGDAFLAINVGPDAILAPQLLPLLEMGSPERVVIELTEHVQIESYESLRRALGRVRELGVRLAIDDTGSGFASLGHLVQLAPDLIKIDRWFTRGIDVDPVRRALAQALLSFARDTGAQVVAEGIETRDELDAVRDLGIPFGQGYFIARPSVLQTVAHDYSERVCIPCR